MWNIVNANTNYGNIYCSIFGICTHTLRDRRTNRQCFGANAIWKWAGFRTIRWLLVFFYHFIIILLFVVVVGVHCSMLWLWLKFISFHFVPFTPFHDYNYPISTGLRRQQIHLTCHEYSSFAFIPSHSPFAFIFENCFVFGGVWAVELAKLALHPIVATNEK